MSPRWRGGITLTKRMIIIPCVCIGLILILLHQWYIITYPAELIPRAEYYPTLRASLSMFPKSLRSALEKELANPISPLENQGALLLPPGAASSAARPPAAADTSRIPNRVFQTDKAPPSAEDARTWEHHGFESLFLNDDDSLAWVIEHFGDSEITRAYRTLPRPVMKADMLRYLIMLAAGGVYSDADTQVLMPLSRWADNAEVYPVPRKITENHQNDISNVTRNASDFPRYPIRIIVGVEGDFHIWRDVAGVSEGMGVTKTGRHRGLQIVQWTIAAQQHHPILIDAVRRIVETSAIARAWEIGHLRTAQGYEAAGKLDKAKKERTLKRPWETDTKGKVMSVQEWTGPAVFTDAVLSYLLSFANVREQDLYRLEKPLQIGDVLVLPMDGFYPMRSKAPNAMARVIHLFRGSWKNPWPMGLDKVLDVAGASGSDKDAPVPGHNRRSLDDDEPLPIRSWDDVDDSASEAVQRRSYPPPSREEIL
ncbi:hypothetical protein DL93DRAFT_2223905 [Clavulina sp. PMI_390]|nr:hypothetical protein DL93DRAFT_2223905 [Clavulina sp. PMI_390]